MAPEQLNILHHTLGLRPDQRTPYRNHFLAGQGHRSMQDLVSLEQAGMMKSAPAPAFCNVGDVVFSCTDAGTEYAIDNLPPEPKRTKYRQYLHDDYSESFADWLGINKPKFEHRGTWRHYEYRMFRSAYGDYYDVCGDWKPTKKEAKASYKDALKKRKGGA